MLPQNQSRFPVHHGKRPALYILSDLPNSLVYVWFYFFFTLFYFAEVFHLLDKEKSGVVRLSLAEVRLVRLTYYVVKLQ